MSTSHTEKREGSMQSFERLLSNVPIVELVCANLGVK